jgi:hypothetical protein
VYRPLQWPNLRKAFDVSQEDFAKAPNYNLTNISSIEQHQSASIDDRESRFRVLLSFHPASIADSCLPNSGVDSATGGVAECNLDTPRRPYMGEGP